MHFFHIQSATMSPCDLTQDAYQTARETWLCGGCAIPKPGVPITNVRMESHCLNDFPLTFVNGAGLPIASRRLLDALGGLRLVERDLTLGVVLDPEGNPLDDWVTFRGKTRLII